MIKKATPFVFAVLILVTFSMTVNAARANYNDVNTGDWYYGSLGAMSENKIISGYPDGSFRGSDTLQVDQLLAMLCRLTDNDVGPSDGYWAQNYIDFAQGEGWLDGLSFSAYTKPINRFETARLAVKALGYGKDNYPSTYEQYEIYVEDYRTIPYYYKDDVLVNYTLGITRGYPDGTFQGYNTLTRAEGAVISHRIFDEDVRKPPLVPDDTLALMALFEAMPPMLAPLGGEVLMPGPMMLFPTPTAPGGIPLPETTLDPNTAILTENVLADSIIAIGDGDSDNLLGAGYDYSNGEFNLNLITAENDSLLMFRTNTGSSVITIDLLNMTDADGNIPDDAIDLIKLICQNIDYDNSEVMLAWILDNYINRIDIPEAGNDVFFDTTLMGISSLIFDHNVLKVTIQTDVVE